jgi:predicted dehydrogenase
MTVQPLRALPISRIPDPATAPPLRWGILSTGGIARAMTDALTPHTRQQVVAVGSRSEESARNFAETFGIDRAHGSMEALLADEQVDAVYVASPHSEHHRQALAAIAAGKHVLVEKAFTRTAAEAAEVVAAARAAGVTAMEAMWTRFLPHIDVLRQLLADGALGEIRTVLADHGQYFDRDPEHRLFNPDLAGGALLDLGIYPVSFASMVLGTPNRITAAGTRAFTGVDGQVSMVLENAGVPTSEPGDSPGAHAVLNTSLFGVTPTTASVAGTVARVDLSGAFYAPGTLTYRHRDGGRLDVDGGQITGHRGLAYEAAHLAQLVADGQTESPLLPLDETVQILRTLDEVRRQIG